MGKAGLIKKTVVLVLILAVPGFLYYLLTAEGKNRYKPLSIFGPKSLAKTTHKVNGKDIPDTIYHTLPDFKLIDQDGKTVSLKTFDSKIFVVDFFYTHCQGACKVANGYISLLDSNYAKNKMIRFVSITVDPEHDSTAVLKKYFNTFKPVPAKWMFLTGDTSTIYPLARNGFLVNALKESNGDFIYSDKIMMVDTHKHIRGYYLGTSPDDMTRLDNEIRVQISEELRNSTKALY